MRTKLGYAGIMTAHGFRSTASLLLNESGHWPSDVIEHALAHQDKNAIRAIYNRTSYWNACAEMMQWWSDQLDALKIEDASPQQGLKAKAHKRPPAQPQKAPDLMRTPTGFGGQPEPDLRAFLGS